MFNINKFLPMTGFGIPIAADISVKNCYQSFWEGNKIFLTGGVFFSWQRTSGGYLATTGYDQVSTQTQFI